ncbi:glycoside hydrolase, catalytic domain-containing protein [Tanacetum coccineum]
MSTTLSPITTFIILLLTTTTTTTTATTIGVTYTQTPTSPPPQHLIPLIQTLHITSIRLINPNPNTIKSFTHTNISLFISIPNTLIPSLSSNISSANLWLYQHVIPFYPRARISAISVGTNLLSHGDFTTLDMIVPAIRNVRNALNDIGIDKITVSTTFSFLNVMTTSFPPSSAEFQEPVNRLVIKPLLEFLTETNSSFFVSLFPYYVYKLRPEIPIGFALFQEHAFNFREDTVTGVRYRNLFDLMVDAVIAAMAVAGHENIPLIVTETGWPCYDPLNEGEARVVYSEMYLRGLVSHLKSGRGTQLRKEGPSEVYVYEMFDTNETVNKGLISGDGIGVNWGFCYANMSTKFEINFSNGSSVVATNWVVKMCFVLFVGINCLSFVIDLSRLLSV